MSGTFRVVRTAVPMLAMVGLALTVDGVRVDRLTAQDEPAIARVAPAPNAFSFRVGGGAYLGVFIREVTSEDVERLDLREERGALISELPDEGPAVDAGLAVDDVIVSWNGSRIESAAQLRRVVGETPAGRAISLTYVRDGRERTAEVELSERGPLAYGLRRAPMDEEARERLENSLRGMNERFRVFGDREGGMVRMMFSGGRLGVGVQNLGDQLAEYFGATDGGVLVTSVREDSPAAAAGLRAGDVIVRVGDQDVEGPRDLMEEIAEAEAGEIEIRVLRDGQTRTLRADLPEREEMGRWNTSGNAFHFGPGEFEFRMPDVPAVPDLELHWDRTPDVESPAVQT